MQHSNVGASLLMFTIEIIYYVIVIIIVYMLAALEIFGRLY